MTEIDSSRGEFSHTAPRFFPDGKHFVYLAISSQPEHTGIYLAAVGSSERRRLVNTPFAATYAGGHGLFIRGNALMAQPLSIDTGRVHGQPFLVERVWNMPTSFWPVAAFSVSNDGMLAYRNWDVGRT